ncbi:MAG TPA: hypothetical protein DCL29_03450 [Eubacterium sp.]|nr:hypothetical protein [Eubacterium sp.]
MRAILKFIKKYSRVIFVIYILVLFLVLVLKFPQMNMFYGIIDRIKTGARVGFADSTNWIPFRKIIEYVGHVRAIDDWFAKNLICNLVVFMPAGFLIPLFAKHNKFWQVLIYGMMISIIVECLQVLLAVGTGDVDDVILNTIGVAIGFGFYKLFYLICTKQREKRG